MKITRLLTLTCAISLNVVFAQESNENDSSFATAEESYFGQNRPGTIAEVFAPGVVSVNGRYEYAVSFSPDLDEMYFSGEWEDGVQSVYFSRLEDGNWTHPKKSNFTRGQKKNEFEAFVNISGDKIYFAAYDSIFSDEKIWYVNRSGNSLSDVSTLDSPINDDIVFYPNAAANGDLFYTSISKGKMYYAPNINGEYPEVRELGIEYGIHGFISPSQDLILVDASKENDKTKDRDIHVCFKKKDGTWSIPINLGNTVNSNFGETCPSLSPDGKYLFFSRYNEEGAVSNIYWVSTEIISKLKMAYFEREQ